MQDNLFEKIFDSLEKQNINMDEFRRLSEALPPMKGFNFGLGIENSELPPEILENFQNFK